MNFLIFHMTIRTFEIKHYFDSRVTYELITNLCALRIIKYRKEMHPFKASSCKFILFVNSTFSKANTKKVVCFELCSGREPFTLRLVFTQQ